MRCVCNKENSGKCNAVVIKTPNQVCCLTCVCCVAVAAMTAPVVSPCPVFVCRRRREQRLFPRVAVCCHPNSSGFANGPGPASADQAGYPDWGPIRILPVRALCNLKCPRCREHRLQIRARSLGPEIAVNGTGTSGKLVGPQFGWNYRF